MLIDITQIAFAIQVWQHEYKVKPDYVMVSTTIFGKLMLEAHRSNMKYQHTPDGKLIIAGSLVISCTNFRDDEIELVIRKPI